MATHTPFMSEFGRELIEEGRVKGRVEGRHEGELAGKRGALFAILQARRLEPAPAERERIEACDDAAVLDAWIRRAVTAGAISEIFTQG